MKKILGTIVYGVLIYLCLGMVFYLPYRYIDMVQQTNAGEESFEDYAELDWKKGTYCTLKSNSLDGVPIYGDLEEHLQIGLIPEGKCVEFLEAVSFHDKEWAKLSYCGLVGWLPGKQLHFIGEESSFIQAGSIVYVNAITEKGIKGYADAGIDSEVLAEGILYGEEAEVLALKNGWGQVEYDGKTCWMNMYHMGNYGSNHWKVQTLSSAKAINLREAPDEKSKSLGKVSENESLIIDAFEDGWGHTSYEGMEGWVMLHYLLPMERRE